MSDGECKRCGGTGWYAYDDNHSKVCEVCCLHDQGWWPLDPELHGKAGYACKRGCGEYKERSDE